MLFRRVVWLALGIALLVGTIQWVFVQWQAVPIILAAEKMEEGKAEVASPPSDHHAGGSAHIQKGWEPENGFERGAWTWMASVLLQFGLALLMLVGIGVVWRRSSGRVTPFRVSLLLAAVAYFSFYAWPALGLPPEIPGIEAARLGSRQGWWGFAAVSALTACAVLFLNATYWKWLIALCLLALPFVIGAPHIAGDPMAAFDRVTSEHLRALAARFLWTSTALNAVQWLALGVTCGLAGQRWLVPLLGDGESPRHRPLQA